MGNDKIKRMQKRFIPAQDIIAMLEADGIYSATGQITMTLKDVTVVYKETDAIGNLLQAWLCNYLAHKRIYFRPPEGQNFPDFYLSESNLAGLCEMKSYLYPRSPAFDVANFQTYIRSLREHPERLDTDYLIVNYTATKNGEIGIKQMWLKKIWEITGPAEGYALKCQRKNRQLVNIRPATWTGRSKFPPFNNPVLFLQAVSSTIQNETNSRAEAKQWLDAVVNGYRNVLPDSRLSIALQSIL